MGKTLLTIGLLCFVAVSLGYIVVDGFLEPAVSWQPKEAGDEPTTKLIVYYFHGNLRCPTCRTIEVYSKKAVEAGFSGQLREGTIVWRKVNFEAPENEQFVKEFDLFASSLVLATPRETDHQRRFKVLNDVWVHTNDRDRFIEYVQKELQQFMEKQ